MSDRAVEQLAAHCHNVQWRGWVQYLFDKSTWNDDGTVTIPAWAVERWQRQMSTPYSRLSEDEQESDRKEARAILALLEPHPEATDA